VSAHPETWPDETGLLSEAAAAIWAAAARTTWGCDNGRSFAERIRRLPDPADRQRLCRMLMDRQHASYNTLWQIGFEAWQQRRRPGERPSAHARRYGQLHRRGAEFRQALGEILDGAGPDIDQAELLTVWHEAAARWLEELRLRRDQAIMNSLAAGSSPHDLARRLALSRTHIINIRHRYLRHIESVGSRSDDLVYHSRDGVVAYVNDALRTLTGLAPDTVIGRPTCELSHPEDYSRLARLRDEAIRRGRGRFRGDLRLRTVDGGWRWFQADFRVMQDPGTGLVHVQAVARPRRADAVAPTVRVS
jgi:PAS domain S-box-containing protein